MALAMTELPPPMWDPGTRAFDGARLHLAIVSRGWTLYEFSRAAKLALSTVYKAVKNGRMDDRSTTTIFETLAKREPMGSVR